MLKKIESELVDILASAITSGVLKQSPSELSGLITLLNTTASAEATGRLVTELNPQKIYSDPSLDIITSEKMFDKKAVLFLAIRMYHYIMPGKILQNQILQQRKSQRYHNS